jgi:hypothetical protein
MPQIFTYLIAAILLIAAAFVAFYLVIALLVVGIGVYAFLAIRRWLVAKGIVNAPRAASPFDDALDAVFEEAGRPQSGPSTAKVTVIEAEFETLAPPKQDSH